MTTRKLKNCRVCHGPAFTDDGSDFPMCDECTEALAVFIRGLRLMAPGEVRS